MLTRAADGRPTGRRRGVGRAALFAAALSLAVGAVPAVAATPVGSQFRISETGTDGDTSRIAFETKVAYNGTANEYLVVWTADDLVTGEFEVFGQRVSAAGEQLGDDFRISNATDVAASRDARSPAVTYNPQTNEYLVVWGADQLATDDELEIFGQRVSASGDQLDGDFRISTVGLDTDATRDAFSPAIAYGSQPNQYLVVWGGDDLATDNELEVFGQHLSATGDPVGGDFQISSVGPDADAARGISSGPAVAYGSQPNEYLVAWDGDDLADEELEIFGQRVSAVGAEVGPDDFRISNTVPDGDTTIAFRPAVAYGSAPNEYLVAFNSESLGDNQEEVFGQRVSALGAEVGGDFRISNASDVDISRDATNPAVAYDSLAAEYLVAFQADELSDGDFEIFGQSLSSAGAEVGGDFRVSVTGPEGDPTRFAGNPALAFASKVGEHLVGWRADALATPNENEIFGRRVAGPVQPLGPGPGPVPGPAPCGITITGTAADDVITGTPCADVIVCGAGNDLVRAGGGDDVIRCGSGNDTVEGGDGADSISGESGNDTLRGGSGADRVFGGTGSDLAAGGSGRDRVEGGRGGDSLFGNASGDRVIGGSGTDRIRGGSGNDRLSGSGSGDRIGGGSGNDRLRGGSGNDRLLGGSGNDLLIGGRGRDVLRGGPGRDTQRQ